jgi:hypothetical protein
VTSPSLVARGAGAGEPVPPGFPVAAGVTVAVRWFGGPSRSVPPSPPRGQWRRRHPFEALGPPGHAAVAGRVRPGCDDLGATDTSPPTSRERHRRRWRPPPRLAAARRLRPHGGSGRAHVGGAAASRGGPAAGQSPFALAGTGPAPLSKSRGERRPDGPVPPHGARRSTDSGPRRASRRGEGRRRAARPPSGRPRGALNASPATEIPHSRTSSAPFAATALPAAPETVCRCRRNTAPGHRLDNQNRRGGVS